MNFYDYISSKHLRITPDMFKELYLDTDLVQVQHRDQFPLDIYCYGRKAVQNDHWDYVTCRCRGIVVNRETGEIIARPFEKFHNYGSTQAMETPEMKYSAENYWIQKPTVWEKVDGFLCTLYTWEGVPYIASKGSFHSIHAKWATAEYRRHIEAYCSIPWPEGYTPVFEGLHRDLRIVVDYGQRQGLILLALVNNETGEEMEPEALELWGDKTGFDTPERFNPTWASAVEETRKEHRGEFGTEEGYVMTWYRPGQTPFRLKLKFIEYL